MCLQSRDLSTRYLLHALNNYRACSPIIANKHFALQSFCSRCSLTLSFVANPLYFTLRFWRKVWTKCIFSRHLYLTDLTFIKITFCWNWLHAKNKITSPQKFFTRKGNSLLLIYFLSDICLVRNEQLFTLEFCYKLENLIGI